MNSIRLIRKIKKGKPAVDGAGVKLVRVFGYHDVQDFNPFLLLDTFDSKDPRDYIRGFPWHPHRGIETITYLMQGSIEHRDSLGNRGTIRDGDCQWMTAGSGIIHQEMPQPAERMLGSQLWLNLPAADKMTDPRYGDIKKENIPVLEENGNKIHVIAGNYQGTTGAFTGTHIQATYLDLEIMPGREWLYDSDEQSTLIVYIVQGEGSFDPGQTARLSEKQAVLFGPGRQFQVKAAAGGIRFLLLEARPLQEPVAWGGSIVMNTQEELDLADRELDENTFIKVKSG